LSSEGCSEDHICSLNKTVSLSETQTLLEDVPHCVKPLCLSVPVGSEYTAHEKDFGFDVSFSEDTAILKMHGCSQNF